MTTNSNFNLAIKDIIKSILDVQFWLYLSWSELKRRYSRTILGPFWATLSMGIFIFTTGILYAKLWKVDINEYLPYICTSILAWNFISMIITEGCTVFINSAGTFKEIPVNYTLFVLDVIVRNIFVFFHCFIIYLILIPFFPIKLHYSNFSFLIGLLIVALNGLWIVLISGMVCARFRDILPLVSNILQIVFFITPVIWRANNLSPNHWLILYNPFYHMIESIRAPLLNLPFPFLSIQILAILFICGMSLSVYLFSIYKNKLIYWI